MVYEPRDYTALVVITHNAAAVAFPGDGVTRYQVEGLGLKVGVQVKPERTGLVDLPDKGDTRDAWYNYAVNQPEVDVASLDDMTRAQLIAAFSGEEPAEEVVLTPPAHNAKKADWVAYAIRREPALTEEDANKLTREELIARYDTGGTLDQEESQGLQRVPVVDPDADGQPKQK